MPPLPILDDRWFRCLNAGATNRVLDALFPMITSLHQQTWLMATAALAAVAALWRGGRGARLWVVTLLLSVALSDVTCSRIVKGLVHRQRPCQAVARGTPAPTGFAVRVVNPERCPGSGSFPSNHASNTMAGATVAWYLTRRRWRWMWFLLPLVIGYTRIYLGYHYPSDVVGGWILGGAVSTVVILVASRWMRDRVLPR